MPKKITFTVEGLPDKPIRISKKELMDHLVRLSSDLIGSVSPSELAFLLGYDRRTIFLWIEQGRLKRGEDFFYTPAGRIRIKMSTLQKLSRGEYLDAYKTLRAESRRKGERLVEANRKKRMVHLSEEKEEVTDKEGDSRKML